jgi:monovalent cation:H+ antiporter-2, CPA2 family
MPHAAPLISTIVAGIVLSVALGAVANRLKVSPLIGYLLAGILVGPFTPGFVADASLAQQLAEIGVILLMFGVGLHFSLEDLLSVRGIAIPGAIAQIAAATALGTGLAHLMGWSLAVRLRDLLGGFDDQQRPGQHAGIGGRLVAGTGELFAASKPLADDVLG